MEEEFKNIAIAKSCNVEFVGYIPYRKMAAYLVKSDVLINSFVKKAPQSIVTKIGDYLAAGKPMINTLTSLEFRKKVEMDGFGINVEAENVNSLVDVINRLHTEKEQNCLRGERAREVAENQFDRKYSYQNIRKLIEQLL